MPNQPALEPSTAPRDPAAYENISPFQIRILVQKLGGFETTEKTAAWHQLGGNKSAQVEYALQLLKAWDLSHSNGATNGATHIAPVAASAVAAVRPDATAAATAAAQPTAGKKSARAPVTTQTTSMGAPGPSNIDLGASVLKKLDEIQAQVGVTAHAVSQLEASMKANATGALEPLTAIVDRLDQFSKTQAWTLTTLLVFAENQMGAAQIDLLRSAVTDADALATLIQQVREELGK